jgi:hypothetical protein
VSGPGPMYEDLENPSTASQALVDYIECWPSYSPNRYEFGLKQVGRVRAELDALERSLLAAGLREGITAAQLARWRRASETK